MIGIFRPPHAAIGRKHDIAGQRIAPRAHQPGKINAADFLFGLEDETQVDRRFLSGQEERFCRQNRQQHRGLVVADAAAVESSVPRGEDKRRRVPQFERFGRLHVHVAVDEDGRGAGRAVPTSEDGRVTRRLPRLDLDGAGFTQPLRHPLGGSANVGTRGPGRCSPTEWRRTPQARAGIAAGCRRAFSVRRPCDWAQAPTAKRGSVSLMANDETIKSTTPSAGLMAVCSTRPSQSFTRPRF